MALPFDRLLNLIYAFSVQGAQDEKERDRFDVRLNTPVPGMFSTLEEQVSPWAPEKETAALSGLAAALRGGDS